MKNSDKIAVFGFENANPLSVYRINSFGAVEKSSFQDELPNNGFPSRYARRRAEKKNAKKLNKIKSHKK